MKSLRYFFCIVMPPLAVLLTGRLGSFFLSLLLTLLGGVPGMIHAILVVNDYEANRRAGCSFDEGSCRSLPWLQLRSGLFHNSRIWESKRSTSGTKRARSAGTI